MIDGPSFLAGALSVLFLLYVVISFGMLFFGKGNGRIPPMTPIERRRSKFKGSAFAPECDRTIIPPKRP